MDVEKTTDFLQTALNVHTPAKTLAPSGWNPHAAFDGVSLKHVLTAKDTNNQLSAHIVKVHPGRALFEHEHTLQWELHEVAAGEGTAVIGDKKVNYRPGTTSIIPAGTKHSVVAGEKGLLLLAKFFPPLM